MASSSLPTLVLHLLLLLLLSQPLHSFSIISSKTTKPFTRSSTRSRSASNGLSKPLILPLKKQTIPSHSLPKPPNKLLFHHNVSLTVPLSVGTPPQNVSLVLDTGSELTWLRCNSSAAPPRFRPASSSSYYPLPCSSPFCSSRARDLPVPATCDSSSPHRTPRCHVSLSYADASSSEGSLSVDTFLVGQALPFKTVFGCMDSSYSSSTEDALTAGLLGMNRGALSFITQSDIRKFSYCISDSDSSGVLLIGESNLDFLVQLNYTPLVEISLPLPYFDRVAYSVQLEGIKLANTILPIPKSVLVPDHTGAGQTMVDSGTQFTFLLGPAYQVLKSEFLRQTKQILRVLDEPDFVFQGAFDTCFLVREGTPLPYNNFPGVSLVFRGAEVRVMRERLLYRAAGERRGKDGVWCLTFGNSDLVPMEAYVIGHHHQQNVWVEYDLENGRVGFAAVQCDKASQRLGLEL